MILRSARALSWQIYQNRFGVQLAIQHELLANRPAEATDCWHSHPAITAPSASARWLSDAISSLFCSSCCIAHKPCLVCPSNRLIHSRLPYLAMVFGMFIYPHWCVANVCIYYTTITNLMHWLLFIRKILLSSTCFEHQVLIFRRT